MYVQNTLSNEDPRLDQRRQSGLTPGNHSHPGQINGVSESEYPK
jgi:hypothetical protein